MPNVVDLGRSCDVDFGCRFSPANVQRRPHETRLMKGTCTTNDLFPTKQTDPPVSCRTPIMSKKESTSLAQEQREWISRHQMP